jgi:predicted Zn-dependent peptidase
MAKKLIMGNGTGVLYDYVPSSRSVSLGFWLNRGSRDENENERGFSHFTEHMLFKGTKRRDYRTIAQEIDSIGGEINGITGKESTNYYVNVAAEHFERAFDILSDMFFNSTFPAQEFEKERYIIFEEGDMIHDDPEDWVFELFEKALWRTHPLGLSVIGEKKNIRSTELEDLIRFYHSLYTSSFLIISVAGNISETRLLRSVENILLNEKGAARFRLPRRRPTPAAQSFYRNRRIKQVYFVCGGEGLGFNSEDRFSMELLNMVIGSSFSSRLFQNIREKSGLCYSIGSSTMSYSDTGEFTISFSTSRKNLHQVLEAVDHELKRVKTGDVKKEELQDAKGRFKGSYILAEENNEWKMIRMAVQECMLGRIVPREETLDRIERVTLADINRVACALLNSSSFSFACVGPCRNARWLENYHFSF